jgi:ElaB/YqjD/DUF883 family membrane-anchored ribosome-binding protein
MTTPTPSSKLTDNLAGQAAPSADEASTLTAGVDAVQARIHRARDNAQHASNATAKYIRSEPIKSLLIAGAVGAALMAVVKLAVRLRGSRIDRTPRNPPV